MLNKYGDVNSHLDSKSIDYLYIVHCTRKTSCSEIIQLSCKSNIDIIYESSLTDLIINEIYPIYMCFFNLFSYT